MVQRLDYNLEALLQEHATRLGRARPEYTRLDKYYEGIHRLEQLQLAIPTELEQFVVFVNWCRKAVDSVENRLDLLGFQFPDDPNGAEDLTETWGYNDMWTEITMGFLDSLSLSVSYLMVGTNEEDPEHPLITVESPTEMTHIIDPRTKKMESMFRSFNTVNGIDQNATLYLPDETYWLEKDGSNRWYIGDYDNHNLGRVPGVAMINRPRTHRLANWKIPGSSQMADVIGIVDAAARALTNAQIAQEVMATPQRGVLGATKGDFVDEAGNPIPAWEAYFGSVWALGNPEAKTFEFSSADMKNFETIVNLYARQASGVTGLPPNYFGLIADDAASDAAIKSRETQLVKFAERTQDNAGNDIRKLLQVVDRFKTGEWRPEMRQLQPLWRNAGTPTLGQVTDAAVKLKEADVLDRLGVWEELNYSPAKIKILTERFEKRDAELAAAGVNDLLRGTGLDENGVPVAGTSGGPNAGVVPTAPSGQ